LIHSLNRSKSRTRKEYYNTPPNTSSVSHKRKIKKFNIAPIDSLHESIFKVHPEFECSAVSGNSGLIKFENFFNDQ